MGERAIILNFLPQFLLLFLVLLFFIYNMTKKVDFTKYADFVDGVTSHPSKDYQCFIESVSSLNGKGANIERLLTAAVGISAEGGEFMENR